jgi:hypothetical protein
MSITTWEGRPHADFSPETAQDALVEGWEDFMVSLALVSADIPVVAASRTIMIKR